MRRKHSLRRGAERKGDGVYLGKRAALDPEKKKRKGLANKGKQKKARCKNKQTPLPNFRKGDERKVKKGGLRNPRPFPLPSEPPFSTRKRRVSDAFIEFLGKRGRGGRTAENVP